MSSHSPKGPLRLTSTLSHSLAAAEEAPTLGKRVKEPGRSDTLNYDQLVAVVLRYIILLTPNAFCLTLIRGW
jgi:hypothetical protein